MKVSNRTLAFNTDFFHYIQFQNSQRQPTTQTTLVFESLYRVWRGSSLPNYRNYMPIFFTISSFKTFGGCQSIQLHKLHLNSNDIVQLRLTDQYQLQKLHADFFHYIQFQNVRRVPVYPTTQTTPKFESHSPAQADRPIPTTETTCPFFSLYPVSKQSEAANYTNYTCFRITISSLERV